MVRSSREIEVQLTLERLSNNVGILTSAGEHFARCLRLRHDSVKTYGNPVRATTCQNTHMTFRCRGHLSMLKLAFAKKC
jgi:hypothetical protein